MKLKQNLEKLISPVRLGWHGILTAGVSAAAAHYSDNSTIDIIAYFGIRSGLAFYLDSLSVFLRAQKTIKRSDALDERFVKRTLQWYCARQAVRTAAANYGKQEILIES